MTIDINKERMDKIVEGTIMKEFMAESGDKYEGGNLEKKMKKTKKLGEIRREKTFKMRSKLDSFLNNMLKRKKATCKNKDGGYNAGVTIREGKIYTYRSRKEASNKQISIYMDKIIEAYRTEEKRRKAGKVLEQYKKAVHKIMANIDENINEEEYSKTIEIDENTYQNRLTVDETDIYLWKFNDYDYGQKSPYLSDKLSFSIDALNDLYNILKFSNEIGELYDEQIRELKETINRIDKVTEIINDVGTKYVALDDL